MVTCKVILYQQQLLLAR